MDAGSQSPFLTREGDVIVVGRPAELALARGAALVFVVAPALTALGWLGYMSLDQPSLLTLASFAVLGAIAGAVPGGLGAITLARAARASRTREARLDLGERILALPGAEPTVLRDPERVVVEPRGLGWRLRMDDVVLVERAPRGWGGELGAAAATLAEALEAELDVPRGALRMRPLLPRAPRALAALAYAPIDPVALPVSLWVLATEPHPKTRFAAKQSLLLFTLEAILAGGLVVLTAGPLLILGPRVPAPLVLGVLACPLLALAALRSAVRILAAMRAHRGAVWVIPGLSIVSRRWAPAPPPRPAPSPRPSSPPAARAPAKTQQGGGAWWT